MEESVQVRKCKRKLWQPAYMFNFKTSKCYSWWR